MKKDSVVDPFESLNQGVPREVSLEDIENENLDKLEEGELPIDTEDYEEDNGDEGQDNDENSENTETEDPTDPEYTVEIEGNPIFLVASKWKEEGLLPADFEIKEDITEDEFSTAFYAHKEKEVISDLKGKVLDQLMEDEGLTPEALKTAKLLHFGTGEEDIKNIHLYKSLGSVELDQNADDYEENVKDLGYAYYIHKGFSPKQAERYVGRDLMEDDLTATVDEYQVFFSEAAKTLEKNVIDKAEAKKLADKQDKLNKLELINNLFEKGEIDGVKYPKNQLELARKALFDRTEVITDSQGNSRYVTLEQRKTLELTHNPEKRLKARIDFILNYLNKPEDTDSVIKATRSLTSGLKKLVKVTPKNPSATTKNKAVPEFETELYEY
jgi:hypothetical protein